MTDTKTSVDTTAEFEASDRHLRKAMPFQNLLFMSMGTIIGSGWLLASVHAATTVGPAAIFSWIIGGIFLIFLALNWAEIAGMIPRTGAIIRYPALTHGSLTGWLIGWAYWFPVTPAVESIAVLTYLSGRFPSAHFTYIAQGQTLLTWPTGILTGFAGMCLFFVLNFFGIRFLAEWNRWFTWWKIVIPCLTFIGLFFLLKGSNFTSYGGFFPKGPGAIFSALSTTGIVFAYLGFRQSLEYGGEARNPQRDVPLATIGGVLIAMVIYTLLQAGFIGAINWHSAGISTGNWGALDTSKWGNSPLYSALSSSSIAAVAAFGVVLLIDAAVSPTGTAWISLGTATRSFYGLSVNKQFPRLFQWMNWFGIPWVSLVASFVIGLIFFIPAPSWAILVSFITATGIITYIVGCSGIIVMRRFAPTMYRPFRLPGAWVFAPLGFLVALLIMYWSGFSTLDNAFAAIFIGFPIYGAYFSWRKGYVHWAVGSAISIVFLGTFIWVNHMGGWTLSINGQVKGSWSFPAYDIAFSADVLFFVAALWFGSTAVGRVHIQNGLWLVFLMLASFPLSYWGSEGPANVIGFPWDTLIEIGIGIVLYVWSSYSGFATEDLTAIIHTAGQEVGTGPLPILPGMGSRPTAAPPLAGGSDAGS